MPMQGSPHSQKLFPDSLDSARYIVIQSRMSRLEDGGVVFFATDEEVRGIYLADIQYGVNSDFNYLTVKELLVNWWARDTY